MKEFKKWIERQKDIDETSACRTWRAAIECAIRMWDKYPFEAGGRILMERELNDESI